MSQKQVADRVQAILKNAPNKPGVYKMLDAEANVIYVGKAKSLRKRLQSYFRTSAKLEIRKQKMVEKVVDIDYIEVNSELESLILETNIIKELRPRYNVLMKDDKNYVYIRVSTKEDFPRLTVVRKIKKDGARYFGPKTQQWKVKQTLRLLKKIFPFRHCRLDIKWEPDTAEKVEVTNRVIKFPCLDYHIKRCVGPCAGVVAPKEYKVLIDRVIKFLEGDYEELKQELMNEMRDLAANKKFEQAALLRDKLSIIDSVQEKQSISDPIHEDLDVINFAEEQGQYFLNLFQVRDGKLLGQENFIVKAEELSEESSGEVLEAFITQYYANAADIPKRILIPLALSQRGILEEWLKELTQHKVEIVIPHSGRKNSLLDLAKKNAKSYASQMRVKWLSEERHDPKTGMEQLKKLLKLPRIPKRIECYDISHLGGTETVGSMVVFENGFSKSDHYRHFQLRGLPVSGKEAKPDDFASMEEVLTRRLKYLSALPDGISLRKPSEAHAKLIKDEAFDRELAIAVLKKGAKKPLAVFYLLEKNDKAAHVVYQQISKKLDVKTVIIPYLQQSLKKFKYSKYYLEKELADAAPISILEIGGMVDRTNESQYILERYRFALTDPSLNKTPDLIVIDGGKGQLSSALKAFKKLGIKGIKIVSLAKKREEMFLPAEKNSIILADASAEKFLMQRLRDEAHRFAVTYNRKRRNKKMTQSQLDDIPGVGDKIKMKLLQEFGSIDAIAKADETELARVTNKNVAKLIKTSLVGDV